MTVYQSRNNQSVCSVDDFFLLKTGGSLPDARNPVSFDIKARFFYNVLFPLRYNDQCVFDNDSHIVILHFFYSILTIFRFFPSRNASIFNIISSISRVLDSTLAQDICGVIISLVLSFI